MGFETCLGRRTEESLVASGSSGGEGCYRLADRKGWRWWHTHTQTGTQPQQSDCHGFTASASADADWLSYSMCVCLCVVSVYVHRGKLGERQHSRVLKQLRALIRLQAEISHDDKNSQTGLEESASRTAAGGAGIWCYWKSAGIPNASSMLQPGRPGAIKLPKRYYFHHHV